MSMSFHERVSAERRRELEKAREHGKAFVVLMGEGNLVAAQRALTKARRFMDGDLEGRCQMCGEDEARYETCSGCFFLAHQPEKRRAGRKRVDVTQEQIESVWDELGVVRLGRDMTNECRLAAALVRLRQGGAPE